MISLKQLIDKLKENGIEEDENGLYNGYKIRIETQRGNPIYYRDKYIVINWYEPNKDYDIYELQGYGDEELFRLMYEKISRKNSYYDFFVQNKCISNLETMSYFNSSIELFEFLGSIANKFKRIDIQIKYSDGKLSRKFKDIDIFTLDDEIALYRLNSNWELKIDNEINFVDVWFKSSNMDVFQTRFKIKKL